MPRHAQFTRIFTVCDNCGCHVQVTPGTRLKRNMCPDCLAMVEERRLRNRYILTGTYHMIADPDQSWGYDCWFSRCEILRDISYFAPGTRFEAKGAIYEVTAEYRLERVNS